MANIIDELNRERLKTDLPQFGVGDTVRIHVKVTEGTRERIQALKVCMRRRGGGGGRQSNELHRAQDLARDWLGAARSCCTPHRLTG